ncbi:hypothetical protein BGZ73_004455 [Actinomortierella ambigua]|nr:hypothetical protein BGZ73_004455 [Actinomortierella ambigua]
MAGLLILTPDGRRVIHWQGVARLFRFYLTISFALAIMAAIVYGAVRAESSTDTTAMHPGGGNHSHRDHTTGHGGITTIPSPKGEMEEDDDQDGLVADSFGFTPEEIAALENARHNAVWPPPSRKLIKPPMERIGTGRAGRLDMDARRRQPVVPIRGEIIINGESHEKEAMARKAMSNSVPPLQLTPPIQDELRQQQQQKYLKAGIWW